MRYAISSFSNSGSSGSCPSGVSNSGAAQKKALPSRDRRTNIILFGLPEKDSLEDTKSIVDEVFSFVVGKVVKWSA